MDIHILDKTEFEASRELWKECFGDGDGFTDWYYRTRTRPEYVLGAFIDGALVSMLHMRPMRMRLAGRERSVCFVAGVSTKPEFRRRGICASLFDAAFPIMAERGFEATALQPFRATFYERFGYKTFIRRRKITLSHERAAAEYERAKSVPCRYDAGLLARLYSGFIKRREGASVRDEEYFRGFIEEFTVPEARLVVTENGCCAGYAEDGGSVFRAYELFFREGTEPLSLLPDGFEGYVLPLPEDAPVPAGCGSDTEDFSMIKPLSPLFSVELADHDRLKKGSFYGFDMY